MSYAAAEKPQRVVLPPGEHPPVTRTSIGTRWLDRIHPPFHRGLTDREAVERHGITLIQALPKPDAATPPGYRVAIQVKQARPGGPTLTESVTLPYYYVTDDAELPGVVAWCRRQRAIGLDLETGGLDPFTDGIATIQLGTPKGPEARAYVIDVRCVSRAALADVFAVLKDPAITKVGQNLNFECRWLLRHYRAHVRNVWDTQLVELVLRCGLLNKKGARTGKGVDRAPYKATSMTALAQRYLGLDIDKDHDLRTSFYSTPPGEHTLRQIVYAASDVIYPFYITDEQRPEVDGRKLRGVLKVEHKALPVFAQAEVQGMRVDTARWRRLWQEAVRERARVQAALDALLEPINPQPDLFDVGARKARPIYPKKNEALNYDSAEQVKWLIKTYCESIQWPLEIITSKPTLVKRKKAYGAAWLAKQAAKGRVIEDDRLPDWLIPEDRACILVESDKDTLVIRKCRGQLPRDLVDLLLEYSKWSIRCDTFGNDFIVKHVRPDTGRMHPTINQCLTNTGRTSTEPNTQNWPSGGEYRACCIPGDGGVFVIFDLSQQEPRAAAQASKDPVYLETYRKGGDLYVEVCCAMTGDRPDKHTPEGNVRRQIFKIIVLSMAYRAGVAKLRDQLTLGLHKEIMEGKIEAPTHAYAAELHKRFFEVHEQIQAFQNACSESADPNGEHAKRIWDRYAQCEVTYTRAGCGRMRLFTPDSLNTYTEGANAPIQGISATMIKAACGLFQDELDARGWEDRAWVSNVIHDEIVAESDREIAEEVAPLLKACMERAGWHYLPDVGIVAEPPDNSNGIVPYWTKKMPKPAAAA